jgi:hypothetical protein
LDLELTGQVGAEKLAGDLVVRVDVRDVDGVLDIEIGERVQDLGDVAAAAFQDFLEHQLADLPGEFIPIFVGELRQPDFRGRIHLARPVSGHGNGWRVSRPPASRR